MTSDDDTVYHPVRASSRRYARVAKVSMALILTCISVGVHREMRYGSEASFGGGWPLTFLVDRPGISVPGRLTLLEDDFRAFGFLGDLLIWYAAIYVTLLGWRLVRRGLVRSGTGGV